MITVYITTHNRKKLLERALNSVLNQTMRPTEIIVVDDASKDNTAKFMQDFCLSYPFVKYIRNEQCLGAQKSRNIAIRMSSNIYITGLDDDDEFYPERLEKLFLSYRGKKLSFICDHIAVATKSKIYYPNKYCGNLDLKRMFDFNIAGPQVFTETSKLLQVNGFDEDFAAWQDYDMWIRLIITFGDGFKIRGTSYIQHTEHDSPRITTSGKQNAAYEMFVDKYSLYLTRRNVVSLKVLNCMMNKSKVPIHYILELFILLKFRRALSAIKSNILGFNKI